MEFVFVAETMQEPASDAPPDWTAYGQQLGGRLLASTDFQSQLGDFVLAIRSGAFGSIKALVRLLGPYGAAIDADGQPAVIRYGYRDGLSADELFAAAAGMRRRIFQVWQEWDRMNSNLSADAAAERFNVLARARRAP